MAGGAHIIYICVGGPASILTGIVQVIQYARNNSYFSSAKTKSNKIFIIHILELFFYVSLGAIALSVWGYYYGKSDQEISFLFKLGAFLGLFIFVADKFGEWWETPKEQEDSNLGKSTAGKADADFDPSAFGFTGSLSPTPPDDFVNTPPPDRAGETTSPKPSPAPDEFAFDPSAFHKARATSPQPAPENRDLKWLQAIVDAIGAHDLNPNDPQTPERLAHGFTNQGADAWDRAAHAADQQGQHELATLIRATAAILRGDYETARAIHEPLRLGYSGKKLLEYQKQRLLTDQRGNQ